MNQQKQISNAMDVLSRASKYMDIANNVYAIAYDEAFSGEVDEHIMYAAEQAVRDCIACLRSIEEPKK